MGSFKKRLIEEEEMGIFQDEQIEEEDMQTKEGKTITLERIKNITEDIIDDDEWDDDPDTAGVPIAGYIEITSSDDYSLTTYTEEGLRTIREIE